MNTDMSVLTTSKLDYNTSSMDHLDNFLPSDLIYAVFNKMINKIIDFLCIQCVHCSDRGDGGEAENAKHLMPSLVSVRPSQLFSGWRRKCKWWCKG